MSAIILSSIDILGLHVALHTIRTNPEACPDFPLTPESTEKLAALLDSLLLATAPGTKFTLEEAPDHLPCDDGADRSGQRADKIQHAFGVTRAGSGDLVSASVSLGEFSVSPSYFRLRIPHWRVAAHTIPSAARPLSICCACRDP